MSVQGMAVVEKWRVRCGAPGCRLHEISTMQRCCDIAKAHELASGHRATSIQKYEHVLHPQPYSPPDVVSGHAFTAR